MNDDRARDALDLAERALDAAMQGGVSQAEALVIAEDEALTRFANSQIHQNVAEIDVTVNLRVAIGKRVGVASSGRTDHEGLRRDVAVEIVRVQVDHTRHLGCEDVARPGRVLVPHQLLGALVHHDHVETLVAIQVGQHELVAHAEA